MAARRASWTSVLGVTLLAACGGGAGSTVQNSAAPATSASSPASVADAPGVPTALDFDAPLIGGGRFDARTYAGQPLALWFWAPY